MPEGRGRELVSLADSVNHMAAELARAKDTQRLFLISISHELRTPLTSVRGFAEALSDGAATDVHRVANIILSEARRLERLVEDVSIQTRAGFMAVRQLGAASTACP
jgi:two-component system sensor histidine kinase BaeS